MAAGTYWVVPANGKEMSTAVGVKAVGGNDKKVAIGGKHNCIQE
jgi:hypothetical protein